MRMRVIFGVNALMYFDVLTNKINLQYVLKFICAYDQQH